MTVRRVEPTFVAFSRQSASLARLGHARTAGPGRISGLQWARLVQLQIPLWRLAIPGRFAGPVVRPGSMDDCDCGSHAPLLRAASGGRVLARFAV